MPSHQQPQPRVSVWPAGAKWLAGVLIVLVLSAGMIYSYRQRAELARGRAEWEAEVARVREAGDPLTAAELELYGKIPTMDCSSRPPSPSIRMDNRQVSWKDNRVFRLRYASHR